MNFLAHPNLEQWLSATKAQEERSVYLEDVLVGKPFLGYAWQRLRFFCVGLLLDLVTHAVEFIFLRSVFSGSALTSALLLRAASLFFRGWWWGGLEVMRHEVRQLKRASRAFLIPRLLSDWLGAATLISGVLLGLAVAGLLYQLALHGPTLLSLFSFSIALGLAVEVFVRTYHSGMYAIRRVYRPVGATLGIELAGVAAFACFYPLLGRDAFAVSAFLLVLAHGWVTYIYVRRSYQHANLAPEPFQLFPVCKRVWRAILSRSFMVAGLAASLMRFESLLIFFVVGARLSSSADDSLLISLYIIHPLIRAAHDWAMLFYFDFIRLELTFFERYRSIFQSMVYRLSWLVGFVLWVAGVVAIVSFEGRVHLSLALILLPFFLLRSLLGFSQVRSFAERRYVDLIASGLLLCCGAYVITLVQRSFEGSLFMICALLSLVLVVLSRRFFGVLGADDFEAMTPLHTFLRRLVAVRAPVTVGILSFAEEIEEEKALYLSEILRSQSKYFRGGLMSQVSPRQVIWFYPSAGEGSYAIENLAAEAGGLLETLDQVVCSTHGVDAIVLAIRRGFLGPTITLEEVGAGSRAGESELALAFRELFPEGYVLEPGMMGGSQVREHLPVDARTVIHAALRYTRGFLPQRLLAPFEVSAICRAGDLRQIFLVPAAASRMLRDQWAQLARQVNVRDALQLGARPEIVGVSRLTQGA